MTAITTEKATNGWDLPHAYDHTELVGSTLCKCARGAEHALHKAPVLEKASESITIVTEKGI